MTGSVLALKFYFCLIIFQLLYYKLQLYQLVENICFQDVQSLNYLEHLRKYISNVIQILSVFTYRGNFGSISSYRCSSSEAPSICFHAHVAQVFKVSDQMLIVTSFEIFSFCIFLAPQNFLLEHYCKALMICIVFTMYFSSHI